MADAVGVRPRLEVRQAIVVGATGMPVPKPNAAAQFDWRNDRMGFWLETQRKCGPWLEPSHRLAPAMTFGGCHTHVFIFCCFPGR